MEPVEIYFAFHHKATLRQVVRGDALPTQVFGHVEAMGYTIDDTWFFLDPNRQRAKLEITHLHDEIAALMAEKFQNAHTVIKTKKISTYRAPIHMPMNCVTQCAALVGLRAFTPNQFQKKLLQNQGVIVHGPQSSRRS